VLVVEGPDGAGKTTLVNFLASHYGFRVENKDKEDRSVPHGPPKRPARESTWEALGLAVAGHTPVLIYDRLFVSELVYGPIVKQRVDLGNTERVLAERVFAALGIPFVLCMPPKQQVLDNVKHNTEQWNVAASRAGEIYDAYAKYWPPLIHPIMYDYTTDDPSKVTRKIDQYLERRKERSW
jgi:GTPase SAR1 family protein